MIEVLRDKIDTNWLCVRFSFDPIWNDRIQKIEGRRWSKSRGCWLVPNRRDVVVKIGVLFGKANCTFSRDVIMQYKPGVTLEEINTYFSRLFFYTCVPLGFTN